MAHAMRDAMPIVTKTVSLASAGSVSASSAFSYIPMMMTTEYNLDSKRTSRVLDILKLEDDKSSSILHHLAIFRSDVTLGNFGQACDKSFRTKSQKQSDFIGLGK